MQWLRFCFRFSSSNSMFILPSLKLATQFLDAVRASPGVAIVAPIYELWPPYMRYGNFRDFSKG